MTGSNSWGVVYVWTFKSTVRLPAGASRSFRSMAGASWATPTWRPFDEDMY